MVERDRQGAGSVVGSAIAFRLFLFFVPLLLFVVGVAGLLSGHVDPGTVAHDAGVSGGLDAQIRTAFNQEAGAGLAGAGRSACSAWPPPVAPSAGR